MISVRTATIRMKGKLLHDLPLLVKNLFYTGVVHPLDLCQPDIWLDRIAFCVDALLSTGSALLAVWTLCSQSNDSSPRQGTPDLIF